jgi:chorismate mutase
MAMPVGFFIFMEAEAMQIDDWRGRIDELDLKILQLLNERARCSLEIGKIKQRMNLPIYMPERERIIFERLEHENNGPLTGAAVQRLFERIIDESRRLEKEQSEETTDRET